jgi:hypothetical protein
MMDFPNWLLNAHPLIFGIAYVAILVVALYWLRALRLARAGVRRFLLNAFYVLAAVYLVGLGFFMVSHIQGGPAPPLIMLAGAFVFLAGGIRALRKRPPRRSRAIPRRVRQAVIARDLKGKPFNPSKHHIDRIWPYSKGGSHSIDNLRVIAKKLNLQKGSKRPRLHDMW